MSMSCLCLVYVYVLSMLCVIYQLLNNRSEMVLLDFTAIALSAGLYCDCTKCWTLLRLH